MSNFKNFNCLVCRKGSEISKVIYILFIIISLINTFKISDGDPLISRKRILIHISLELYFILIFIKYVLSVIRISKTLKTLNLERQVNI